MLCHIVGDVGEDVFRECATLDELWDFLHECIQASGPAGAFVYDAVPETAEDGSRVIRFHEEYIGADE